jgi:hypothetical protein
METCLQPREAVLDFGLLPLQVLCPQLETVAGVQLAHRSLAAAATAGDHGNSKCSCSSCGSEHKLSNGQHPWLALMKGCATASCQQACGSLSKLLNPHA